MASVKRWFWLQLALSLFVVSNVLSARCPSLTPPARSQLQCHLEDGDDDDDDADRPPAPVEHCVLACDFGLVADGASHARCRPAGDADTAADAKADWSNDLSATACVEPAAVVVGGINAESKYEASVEIVAPDHPGCHGKRLADFPKTIVGASGGYVNGVLVVCGGVTDGKLDCIEGLGGSKWCTGPKQDRCYRYNPDFGYWSEHPVRLRVPRAFAGHLVNGSSLLLAGGVTQGAVLDTSEFVAGVVDDADADDGWKRGPRLPAPTYGHCAVAINDRSLLVVAGGFSKGKYLSDTFTFDWIQREWSSLDWSKLNSKRSDAACSRFEGDQTKSEDKEKILAVGGRNSAGSLNSAEVYLPSSGRWDELASKAAPSDRPSSRNSAALATLGRGTPTLIGGVACEGARGAGPCRRTPSLLQYDAGADEWREAGRMGVARSGHLAVEVPVTMFPECLEPATEFVLPG